MISFFVGVVALGAYSNYQNLLNMVSQVIALVLSSLTSILGHLYVKEKQAVVEKYCRSFQLLNYCIGVVFYLGYFAIADNLVEILFFKDLVVARSITFVLTLNGFIQFMRYNTLTFRDATGTFYYDRWKPLVEGIVNLILSVLLVKYIGITGVLVATIITNLVICHIVEPFVLYRYAFEMSPVKYYWNNYVMIIIFFAAQLIVENIRIGAESSWTELFVNGCISVAISAAACILGAFMNMELCRSILRKVRAKNE